MYCDSLKDLLTADYVKTQADFNLVIYFVFDLNTLNLILKCYIPFFF